MNDMKLCVFSDSHGCATHMIRAIEREKPAMFLFLGDGERDLAAVKERFLNFESSVKISDATETYISR